MSKKKKVVNEKIEVNKLESIPNNYRDLIAVIIIVLPLLYYFIPYLVNNVEPSGNDFLAATGQKHLYKEWESNNDETVLWNPNIFSGEPIYFRVLPDRLDIYTLLAKLGIMFYWASWYLLIGGLGLYFLLKYKKIPWYLALIVAVVFVMLPDWQAQMGEGHNSKFRALMVMPWLILSFSYFFDKKTWFSTGLFALAFSWFVKTHHFQIIFYGVLVLFFLYIYPTIELFLKKEFKTAGSMIIKFSIALVVTLLTSVHPLLTTHEYAEYSIRGGNPVQIGENAKSAKKASGVDLNYATQWSFSPNELLDYFIPHFSGGISSEIYNGKDYPQVKGRQIPGYWGEKPMSGNYSNMGMILFLFAIIGIIYNRKNKFVIALAVFAAFSILLSFGRHFIELYKIFFYYLPYFSKFRAPAMIHTVTFISLLILSGYGLKSFFIEMGTKDFRTVAIVFGSAIGVLIFVLLTYNSFAFATAREAAQYDANTLNLLKGIRKELLLDDLYRLLLIIILTSILVIAYIFGKIRKEITVTAILILSVFEIFYVSSLAHSNIPLSNKEQLEQTVFKKTDITESLQTDKSNARAIVIGQEFTSNHYAYFYPLISGYSAIKLQIVQDVIAHNMFPSNFPERINWNIINMLNGKYIISPAQINQPFVQFVTQNNERKEVLYLNKNALPKAWFVKNVLGMKSPEEVVLFMNTEEFKPDSIALIANSEMQKNYSGNGDIELTEYAPNRLSFNLKTDSDQFLVVSEIYYPAGWIAKLNDNIIDIHQVNHLLRGVEIPKGEHELTFEFIPETYYSSLTYLWLGNIIILVLIIVPLIINYKKIREWKISI